MLFTSAVDRGGQPGKLSWGPNTKGAHEEDNFLLKNDIKLGPFCSRPQQLIKLNNCSQKNKKKIKATLKNMKNFASQDGTS